MDAGSAIDAFIAEFSALEPGAEVAFSEIFSFYSAIARVRGWPPASQIVLSRRLKKAGARRFQRRLSATEKPIFYVLPKGAEMSKAA